MARLSLSFVFSALALTLLAAASPMPAPQLSQLEVESKLEPKRYVVLEGRAEAKKRERSGRASEHAAKGEAVKPPIVTEVSAMSLYPPQGANQGKRRESRNARHWGARLRARADA
ncbi:hypothetical protein HDZ31DRAFT_74216 [Schizophyllum fasciatum]